MGSVNPIVVTEAALAARGDAIADGLVASVSNFGGQLCTKPGVVFVPDGAAGDEFARTVAARLDGVEPTVLLNERLRDALAAAVRAARRAPGGAAARRRAASSRARASATSRPPTRRPRRRSRTAPALLEEHFGPVVVLLRYGDARRAARRDRRRSRAS